MIKILVIGESCIDKFIYGDIDRLSPEAPIPVLKPTHIVENRGMCGNVIENLKSLEKNIEITEWTQTEIITKTRYVEQKSNYMFIRIDEGEITPCKPLSTISEDTITNSDIVIVSDYNKGFLDLETIKNIGTLSKLSILDSKKILTDDIVNSYTFIKLNENEFKNNSHLTNINNIIVTLGKKGAMMDNIMYKNFDPHETIDVSGAGDTFVASFILEYFKTKNIKNSITFANKMAAKVVNKKGVSTPL